MSTMLGLKTFSFLNFHDHTVYFNISKRKGVPKIKKKYNNKDKICRGAKELAKFEKDGQGNCKTINQIITENRF